MVEKGVRVESWMTGIIAVGGVGETVEVSDGCGEGVKLPVQPDPNIVNRASPLIRMCHLKVQKVGFMCMAISSIYKPALHKGLKRWILHDTFALFRRVFV
jgi:hypothetical protein